MPKMKTKRGAAKRFKKTGTGKFKRARAFNRHNLTTSSHSRKKQLVKGVMVSPADEGRVRQMLPYA